MKATSALLILSHAIFLFACKKESFITSPDAQVTVTVDSLKYDTVFTTAGSITQAFKIINENNQKLKISSVKLIGGSSSSYKINADGFTGPEINDLEVAANDSIYVFVSVVINQNTNNLPFVIRDSIMINYNGTDRWVQLEAWGQNAHFFRNKRISANETWTNDLPYVILGSLYVEPDKILTIDKGCRIYVHADAPIIVDGSLQINGLKDSTDRVYFRGDRLDDPYKDFPASWPGIFFGTSSKDNIFNYAVLKNAYQAIAAQDLASNAPNPKVTLNECIIDNAYDAGIITLNSSVYGRNCLISNCGKNLYLLKGGNYQFVHCTVASYSNNYILHKDPVLFASNYIIANNVPQPASLTALFRNCIFWGEGGFLDDSDEVVIAKNPSAGLNVNFDGVLWKIQKTNPTSISGVTANGIINNQPPLFDSINVSKRYYDFRLQASSPAKDKGVNASITIDLDGASRPVGPPDLGCYEKH
ncbi:MAG TPA: choice-of-anchor Q domain-containing protein [Chitinophagaceae bacterium]|nr:choice-of-anchor Q domain-containing protein [Chitinophagaceae bacterium]